MSVRRIGLLGGECTGKSTLAADLAAHLPAVVAGEYVRAFVAERGRSPRREEQRGIFDAQLAGVDAAIAAALDSNVAWVIADPLPLMTAVYSVVYFDDHSLLADGIADAQSYDVLVWCAPDVEWTPDGDQRDGVTFRDAADAVIANDIATLLPLVRVAGDTARRCDDVLALTIDD